MVDEVREGLSLVNLVAICFGVADGFRNAVVVTDCRAGRPVRLVVVLDALSSVNVGVERCAPGL